MFSSEVQAEVYSHRQKERVSLLSSMRRELSALEYSVSNSTQAAPYIDTQRDRGGSLDCMWGVQTHSGPPVFLVPFRKELAG